MNPPVEAPSPLKRKDCDPVFDEPWQAQVLAMADLLVQAGIIRTQDWAETLGDQLGRRAANAAVDDAHTYYGAVLAALEDLLYKGGAVEPGKVASLQEQWKRAYLNTPHGSAVELSAAEEPVL